MRLSLIFYMVRTETTTKSNYSYFFVKSALISTIISLYSTSLLLLCFCHEDKAEAIELVIPSGHVGRVKHLSFTKDDRILVSAADDGTIRLWNPVNGYLLRTIEAHSNAITAMAVSPNGKFVASGGTDGRMRIWSIISGVLIHEEALNPPIRAIAWSVDSEQCFVAADWHIFVLDLRSHWRKWSIEAKGIFTSLSYIASSHTLISCEEFISGFKLWDVDSGKLLKEINSLNLIPNEIRATENQLGSLLRWNNIVLFRTNGGLQPVSILTSESVLYSFDLSPDQSHVMAVGNDNKIFVWNVNTAAQEKSFDIGYGVNLSIALNHAGNLAAVGNIEGVIKIVDINSGEMRVLPGGDNHIREIDFGGNSLFALVTQKNQARFWAFGTDDEIINLSGGYLDIQAAKWLHEKNFLIASSPKAVQIFDIRKRRLIQENPTNSIYGFPLGCNEAGLCAWEESGANGNIIIVQDILGGSKRKSFQIGQDSILSLDISKDGSLLAVAVNRPIVRLWSLISRKELAPLTLTQMTDRPQGKIEISSLWTASKKLIIPTPGMPTVITFSPNGKKLAAGNENAIYVWDINQMTEPTILFGHQGHVLTLEFNATGKRLFSSGQDCTVRSWKLDDTNQQSEIVARLSRIAESLKIRSDDRRLAVAFPDGKIGICDINQKKMLGFIYLRPDDGGWITWTLDGLFEASEKAWHNVLIRTDDNTLSVVPLERYFYLLYQSGLTRNLLNSRENPPSAPTEFDFSSQPPIVKLTAVKTVAPEFKLDPDLGIKYSPETVTFRIEVAPGSDNDNINDLRLMQNDTLIREWRGMLKPSVGGKVAREITLELTQGMNRISAYAFNQNQAKSDDAVWERPPKGGRSLVVPSTLYVLAVGIGTYKNDHFHLNFPAADVELLERTLTMSAKELDSMNSRLLEWNTNRVLQNLRGVRQEELPTQIKISKLVNENATRERIIGELRKIIQMAQPQDSLIFFYSGHGISASDHFFFMPYDMGIKGERNKLSTSDFSAVTPTLISDDNLEEELLPLNVSHAAIIIDACESAQALAGSELRGPFSEDRLARMAYMKGIHLLAASQKERPANELETLGHGVLSYALFHDGLLEHHADRQPLDGRIELREWLSYGASRVEELIEKFSKSNHFNNSEKELLSQNPIQQACFAPRRTKESSALILYVAKEEP